MPPGSPLTSDFNTATNWTPATVPTGTATFDASTIDNAHVLSVHHLGRHLLFHRNSAELYLRTPLSQPDVHRWWHLGATPANAPTFNSTVCGYCLHAIEHGWPGDFPRIPV